jgi:hypothetical protein
MKFENRLSIHVLKDYDEEMNRYSFLLVYQDPESSSQKESDGQKQGPGSGSTTRNPKRGTWSLFIPMLFPDEKMVELFNLLDHLAALEIEELLGHFTGDNIEALRLISGVLKEGMYLERVLSEKRFVNVVQELRETKKIWSERLDETLNNAAREYHQGNHVQALWILNGFVRFCPSPYYRVIAEGVIGEYEEQ